MTTSTVDRSPDASREEIARALAFGRRVLRQWDVVFVTLLVGLVAAIAFILTHKPAYRSETVMVYTEPIRLADNTDGASRPRGTALRVQEMLGSRRQLQRIVDEFGLYPEIRRKLGPVDAVEELKKHINFHAPGGDTFTIAFEGESPAQAQRVTSRLAQLVIGEGETLRKTQADSTRAFLEKEKQHSDTELHAAEKALAGFMAEHPSFALDTTPLATGAAIRASTAATKAATPAPKGRPDVVWVPTRAASTPTPPPAPRVVPTRVDPEVAREQAAKRVAAQAELASALTNLADKRARYTDAHPDVVAAREAVARARARLAALPPPAPAPVVAGEVPSPLASDPKPVLRRRVVVQRPASDRGDRGESRKSEERDVVSLETTWARLTRAVSEARQRHDQVEAALFKADIAASSASDAHGAQMTVIDPAYLPDRPVPPGRRTIVAAFAAAAFALGLLIATGRVAYDDRVHDRRGLSGLADVLVEVPRAPRRRKHRA